MSQELTGAGEQERPSGAVLEEIDPDLNIFALANGTDLYRNVGPGPDRVLEWYRDGMERRIVLVPAAGPTRGGVTVSVAASKKRDGVPYEAGRPFRDGVAPGQLRALLPEAIEAANALVEADLRPADAPRPPQDEG